MSGVDAIMSEPQVKGKGGCGMPRPLPRAQP